MQKTLTAIRKKFFPYSIRGIVRSVLSFWLAIVFLSACLIGAFKTYTWNDFFIIFGVLVLGISAIIIAMIGFVLLGKKAIEIYEDRPQVFLIASGITITAGLGYVLYTRDTPLSQMIKDVFSVLRYYADLYF